MNKTPITILVGVKLKQLRLSRGFTVHDVAKKLNKTDQQLFRYERGANKIDLDTIINYLDILQIDIACFFSELYSEVNIKNEIPYCENISNLK